MCICPKIFCKACKTGHCRHHNIQPNCEIINRTAFLLHDYRLVQVMGIDYSMFLPLQRPLKWVLLCFLCCLLIFYANVYASQSEGLTVEGEDEAGNENGQAQPWEPPTPPSTDFDWIQLKSGEWLKGELKVLFKNQIEFDSDELDFLELDWEDIKYVRSHRILNIRIEGSNTIQGCLQATEDKVFVTAHGLTHEFDRDRLVIIAPVGVKETDYWSGEISFGLNLSRGNSEQTQFSTKAKIKRYTSKSRLLIDYLGHFTETQGIQTANNQRLNAFWDVLLTSRTYFRPIFGEYFRDPFSNINYRITVGTGLVYYILDSPKTEWSLSFGPAYQTTRFNSTQAGQKISESTPAFVAGTHFDTELTKTVDLEASYTSQVVNEDSGSHTHHTVVSFKTEITEWLDFDIGFVWNRIQDPRPDEYGLMPKQDDYYLTLGLGIEF